MDGHADVGVGVVSVVVDDGADADVDEHQDQERAAGDLVYEDEIVDEGADADEDADEYVEKIEEEEPS